MPESGPKLVEAPENQTSPPDVVEVPPAEVPSPFIKAFEPPDSRLPPEGTGSIEGEPEGEETETPELEAGSPGGGGIEGGDGGDGGGPEDDGGPEYGEISRRRTLDDVQFVAETDGMDYDLEERERRSDEYDRKLVNLDRLAAGYKFYDYNERIVEARGLIYEFDNYAATAFLDKYKNNPEDLKGLLTTLTFDDDKGNEKVKELLRVAEDVINHKRLEAEDKREADDGEKKEHTNDQKKKQEMYELLLREIFFKGLTDLDNLDLEIEELHKTLDPLEDVDLPYGEGSTYENKKQKLDRLERNEEKIRNAEKRVGLLSGDANLASTHKRHRDEANRLTREIREGMKGKDNFGGELEEKKVSDLEAEIEAALLQGKTPELAEQVDINGLPTYIDIQAAIIGQGENAIIQVTDKNGQQIDIEAKAAKELYFFEARRLGFFDDLEMQYKEDYEGMRFRIFDRNDLIPTEDRRNNLIPVEDRRRFSEAEMKADINSSEDVLAWGTEQDKLIIYQGLDQATAAEYADRFQGVKGDYIRSVYKQINLVRSAHLNIRSATTELHFASPTAELQILNRAQLDARENDLTKALDYLRRQNIAGEFDITKLELIFQKKQEMREKATEKRLYSYRWSTYELTGPDIEEDANVAVDDLLEGSTGYEVNAVMGRMDALVEAVKRDGGARGLSNDKIVYIQRTIINRVLFHLGDFFGAMVQMDNYAAVLQKWANQDGYDRLRVIPTMIGGLAGKALELRYKPEYRMRYRLEGWQGQLYGNQLLQRFFRDNMEELMIEQMMKYQLAGNTDADRYDTRMRLSGEKKSDGKMTDESFDRSFIMGHTITDEQYFALIQNIENRGEQVTEDQKRRLKGNLDPKSLVLVLGREYSDFERQLESKDKQQRNISDLNELKELREEYNAAREKFNRIRREAKSAVEFSGQAMTVFGESDKIGAPSIRMYNAVKDGKPKMLEMNGRTVEIRGDHMSIEDITQIFEYAVMQEAKRIGEDLRKQGYDFEDDGSLIRWRSRRFLAGESLKLRVRNRSGEVKEIEPFKLRQGFETTGLDEREWNHVIDTFENLKRNGYGAVVDGKTVPEILKEMRDLKPVLNHYFAIDVYGSDILTHPLLRDAAARGEEPFFASIYNRLKWFGMERITPRLGKETVSGKRETLEQVLENSRSFHDTMTEMVHYLGIRGSMGQVKNKENYHPLEHNPSLPEDIEAGKFAVKGIYADKTAIDFKDFIYGFPNETLGGKRIRNLNAEWIQKRQQRVARGAYMLPYMRIYAPSLSEHLGANNLLEAIWNMDKEYFDTPWLMAWGEIMQNAVTFRKRGETDIDPEKQSQAWGFNDKLLSDVEQLWEVFPSLEQLKDVIHDRGGLANDVKERVIGKMEDVLVRFLPMVNLMDSSLSYKREAGGSGAGEETAQKATLKLLGWMLSTGQEKIRRLEGGALAHGDAEAIIKFILQEESYRGQINPKDTVSEVIHWDKKAIWERGWEKWRPRKTDVDGPLAATLPLAIAA